MRACAVVEILQTEISVTALELFATEHFDLVTETNVINTDLIEIFEVTEPSPKRFTTEENSL